MIDVKRLTTFPYELDFSAIATKEMSMNAGQIEYVMARSRSWMFSHNGQPLFIGGILKLSLVGGPTRLWFVGLKGFEKHAKAVLRFLRRGLRHVKHCCGELSVVVEQTCRQSLNFARSFGFQSTNHVIHENGKMYRYCVLR